MKAFVIAGEPSGDRLGGAMMEGLHELAPGVTFQGIGGPQMQAQGLTSLFPMDELSVMGLAEILPKYFHLKRRIRETAEAVIAARPDVLITIDSPDFCLRVVRLIKARMAVRAVHYVAPTVWAWRPGRAAKMAEVVDQVLALFPFEPPLMTRAGMECDFVGHPVVAEPVAKPGEIADLRNRYGLGSRSCLLVLPGSRRSEVGRLSDVFGAAVARFGARHPDMPVIVPAAAPVAGMVQEAVAAWPVETVVLDPRDVAPEVMAAHKRAAFATADLALAASGTVSLELAAAQTPMVIAYRMNRLTHEIITRMALIDTVTLVNLVSDTRVVPEFLGPACTPEAIANGLSQVLADPQAQTQAMALTMERLGQGGERPGLRAARAVLDGLARARA